MGYFDEQLAAELSAKQARRAQLGALADQLAHELGADWTGSVHADPDWLTAYLTRKTDGLKLHLALNKDGYGAGAKMRLVVSPDPPRLDGHSTYDETAHRMTSDIRASFDWQRAPSTLARAIQQRIIAPYAVVLPQILEAHAKTRQGRTDAIETYVRLSELLGERVTDRDREELQRNSSATIIRYKDGPFSTVRVRVQWGGSTSWELTPRSAGDAIRLGEILRDWCAAKPTPVPAGWESVA